MPFVVPPPFTRIGPLPVYLASLWVRSKPPRANGRCPQTVSRRDLARFAVWLEGVIENLLAATLAAGALLSARRDVLNLSLS
jgi:hypothetical protein